ncbi:MAG: hypothetical protein KDE55_18200 [Novosphingobium sp.]|nr:hypothetical protein [Novosphingobium sp.]
MLTTFKRMGLAVALAAGTLSMTVSPAQARDRYDRGGDDAAIAIGAGLVGLAIGALLADRDDDRYYDRRYYNSRRYVQVRGYPGRYYYYDGYPNRYYRDRYYDRNYGRYYSRNYNNRYYDRYDRRDYRYGRDRYDRRDYRRDRRDWRRDRRDNRRDRRDYRRWGN